LSALLTSNGKMFSHPFDGKSKVNLAIADRLPMTARFVWT
jgi:hypothetical protein